VFRTGLYGWITSWFGGASVENDSKEAEDKNKAALLDTWSKMEFRYAIQTFQILTT
jgi:hypothetical protein